VVDCNATSAASLLFRDMPSYPSAFRFCPFCGQPLPRPSGADLAQTCRSCAGVLYHGSKPGVGVVVGAARQWRARGADAWTTSRVGPE
jgi:NADH pyrophosphatase NudC (nudix superfamily)